MTDGHKGGDGVRWRAILVVPVLVVAGFAATASSATSSVAGNVPSNTAAESAAPGPTGVGVVPAEPASPASPRTPRNPAEATEATGTPPDPLSQLPPSAVAAAGGLAVLGDGPLAIPELVFYAYRAAEMQTVVDSPECGLPWYLLAALGRLESQHADGGRTDVLGTLLAPKVAPDGALGPLSLPPAVWEKYRVDGNVDGVADPQNVFDSTLAASAWMCADGARLREPDGQARAIALFDPSPEFLTNVRAWSSAYEKGAEVAPGALAPPARPVPSAADIAASAPAVVTPAPAAPALEDPAAENRPESEPFPGAPPLPPLPPLPEMPSIPCLVPALCE